jgi:hypothetical protein
MFKKISLCFLVFAFILGNFFGDVIYADTARDTEATQIAQSLDINPDPWFSNSAKTMSTIKQGLLEINNQTADLKNKGVSETQIARQRSESVTALKDYALATHTNENTNGWNSLLKSKETMEAENGNLKKTQAIFYKTTRLGYKQAGMEKEAALSKDVIQELDAQAAAHYEKSLPDEKTVSSTPIAAVDGIYTLLAPIPAFFPGGTVDVKGAGLGGYLNGLYKAGIAIATGLALIMIVVGGLEYVSTDSIQGKSNGRERIKNAIIGLLLALTSFIILQQINPSLLKSDLNIDSTGSVGGVSGSTVTLAREEEFKEPEPELSNYPITEGIVNSAMQVPTQGGGGITGGINLGTGGGRCKRGPNGINTSGSKIKPRYIPNVNWSSYAMNLIQKSRLPQTRPADAGSYFTGGRVTAEGWLLIIGGMIECESSFNPNTTFQEPGGSKGPGTLSVGLLQMSKEDPEARRKGYTSNDLKDPYKNLEVGIGRLESLVVRDNCITCWTGPGGWRGGSAYWSVLRNK